MSLDSGELRVPSSEAVNYNPVWATSCFTQHMQRSTLTHHTSSDQEGAAARPAVDKALVAATGKAAGSP